MSECGINDGPHPARGAPRISGERECGNHGYPVGAGGNDALRVLGGNAGDTAQRKLRDATADDIRNAGGLYRDQPTVGDSNWVSTRGGDDMAQFNRAMLEKLAASAPPQPV